jgi:hypothetical protein
MKMNTKEAKENYLRELGFTEVDSIEVKGYDTEYNFENNGQFCAIFDDEFEVGDSISDIINASTFYSCCGDILDKDIMICPTCKEHC